MKRFIYSVIIFCSLCACSDDNNNPNPRSQEFISFTLDGRQYQSSYATGFLNRNVIVGPEQEAYNNFGASAFIEGLPNSLFQLQIGEVGEPEPGLYESTNDCDLITEPCPFILFSENGVDEDAEPLVFGLGYTGEIRIQLDQVDFREGGRISGSFTAETLDENGDFHEITDGVFDVVISD